MNGHMSIPSILIFIFLIAQKHTLDPFYNLPFILLSTLEEKHIGNNEPIISSSNSIDNKLNSLIITSILLISKLLRNYTLKIINIKLLKNNE